MVEGTGKVPSGAEDPACTRTSASGWGSRAVGEEHPSVCVRPDAPGPQPALTGGAEGSSRRQIPRGMVAPCGWTGAAGAGNGPSDLMASSHVLFCPAGPCLSCMLSRLTSGCLPTT